MKVKREEREGREGDVVFNSIFLSPRKHSIARRRYLRLATSGEERPTRFTYRNTASARDDSPPLVKLSGGCSNS